jgi:hypothetical protein
MNVYVYTKYQTETCYPSLHKNMNICLTANVNPSWTEARYIWGQSSPTCSNWIYMKIKLVATNCFFISLWRGQDLVQENTFLAPMSGYSEINIYCLSWYRNNKVRGLQPTKKKNWQWFWNLSCTEEWPLVQECRRLSEADHPVACLMKGYMTSLITLTVRNSHLSPLILNHFVQFF